MDRPEPSCNDLLREDQDLSQKAKKYNRTIRDGECGGVLVSHEQ